MFYILLLYTWDAGHWDDDLIINVNPGLINPRLFNWGGTISVAIYYFGGTTTINQPGFINPGLTLLFITRSIS